MADFDGEHAELIVLNLTDDAIVPDPVAPEGAMRGAGERLAKIARVLRTGNPFVHKIQEAAGCLLVELAKLLSGGVGVPNRPGQGRFSPLPRNRSVLRLCGRAPRSWPRGNSLPDPPSPSEPARAGNRLWSAPCAGPDHRAVFPARLRDELRLP